MANFGYDDDVLLKWEITGTGRCEGSYSHFNSMMRRSMKAEQSDIDREPVLWGKQFAGKNKWEWSYCGRGKGVCEARNTYTCGAEAGEVNEMN
jgi:hypothetical protein